LAENEQGEIFVPKWEARQMRSDTSTERVRKYREKQRGTVSETPVKRNGTVQEEIRVEESREDKNRTEKNTAPAIAGEHGAFIEGWCQNYKSVWKVDYQMDGGRDGKAVKELLAMGILRIDLLEIAKKAWLAKPQTFDTKQACTIHGFRAYFNQLNIRSQPGNSVAPNPYAHMGSSNMRDENGNFIGKP
jgi:hypothetical protein